jgi:putative Mg2+ transporter-C (MgtC) family protein
MMIATEDIFKLLLALALGGMVGFERELRDKAAGFRTLMFICTASALFTIFSIRIVQGTGDGLPGDPARIAAQIVSGIGFLGAGVILREHGEIRGLTTAATIWLVAALGVGVGAGQYFFTVLATATILLALFIFPSLERLMGTMSQVRTYEITSPASLEKYLTLRDQFRQFKLYVMSSRRNRRGGDMICTFSVSGKPNHHEDFVEALFNDPDIKEFDV